MRLTLKNAIISHICYREVFRAPVRIDNLKTWLAIEKNTTEEENFYDTINELINEKLIVSNQGMLALKTNQQAIVEQNEKDELTETILEKGRKFLKWFAKIPFVKYVGISGSIAANNPVLGVAKSGKDHLDLDLFVISKKNTLWILFLFERVLTNFRKLLVGHHFYCFNYVTDVSFLEIYNKNFFTATELVNLKTIYNDGVYVDFVSQNEWYEKYYSKLSLKDEKPSRKRVFSFSSILYPVNFMCFSLFCLGRAVKRFDIRPLLEIGVTFNPKQKCNLKRISNANGGYQEAIKKRFVEVFRANFPNYYSVDLIEYLFPATSAFEVVADNVYDLENKELFTKYAMQSNEKDFI